MRRAFWILLTPLAGFLVLYLLGTMVVGPRLEVWALDKIQSYSDSSLPVKIHAERLRLRFFKPSLALENIRIEAKGDLVQTVKKIDIRSVRVFVDFFHLLSGRLTLSAVVVDSPSIELDIDSLLNSKSEAQALPIDEIFAQAEQIPLQRLFLQNVEVKVISKELHLQSTLNNGDLLFTNMGKNLTLKASIPELQVELEKFGSFKGSLDSHLYLTRQSLRILQLGLRLDDSELLARGELTPISQITIKPAGLINLNAKLRLTDIYEEIHRIRPDLKIPRFSGELQLDSETRFNGMNDIRSKADIKTTSVVVDKLELGDARVQGEYKDKVISLSEMKVLHPSGEATLTKSQISLEGDYAFKTNVAVSHMDLQKLFLSLNLDNIPVGMSVKGNIPCAGQILPAIQLSCTDVEMTAKDIWVHSSLKKNASSILDLEVMTAKGDVQVTTQAVNYKAQLSVGSSSGSSSGVIDFDKGFKISYETKQLDFKNVKNLANLKIEGAAGITGTTSGDTDAAIFDLSLNARDFIFEDYGLGNLITEVKYRHGKLSFNDVAGALNKTQYLGDLTLDLNKDTLSGEFSVPSAELNDVAVVFERIYKFPLGVQGQGAAKARLSGPLNFWKMNYHLESAFKGVMIGPESFDSLIFNASALNGNVKADNVTLTKGDSTLVLQGGINSDQVMNLYADGKNWKLEQSDFVSKINSSIIGSLNLSAELKDSVRNPQIMIKGAITDTAFEEQEIPNSNFILRINRNQFSAQLGLFGDKVQGEFQLPFEKGRSPLMIKMKTNKWNYSSLLGLVGGANLASEYESTLTSNVDLKSDSGDIFKSSGSIHIETLSLKRGNMSFANEAPLEVAFNNGMVAIKNFRLSGPSNSLQIRGDGFTADRLNLSVALQSDMRLLQIFAPFLEDLGGAIQLSTTVSGSIQKPEVLGNLNTHNAFVKIKGFPHPIERLSTDVVFSQSKVLISSIRGNIAGGTLTGDGGILINGLKDLPMSIRLHLDGVTFNVPDKVRSSGNADLLLSGRWFPFTLSGTFHVASALVEKEFTDDSGGSAGVRQSFYLPKVIREAQFEPIILDLQLVMDRNIIVRNSLLDGSVSGSLQVKGPPGNPVLLGRINADRKTKLIFKDKIFEIQNGVIDFNDPNEINPNLYITAQSRIDDYDITLLAQGPSKNMTIRLSSVPPLPEQDIISLIALGVTSSAMDQNLQSRQQAEQLGAEIGGAVLAKPINRQLESATGFNLSVTSQYDSTRNISVPKITLSRRLSERVKVSGSRPMRDNQSYDLKLEYLINSNITAVGSFESRGIEENSTSQATQPPSQSIFGLDLEFKREFK